MYDWHRKTLPSGIELYVDRLWDLQAMEVVDGRVLKAQATSRKACYEILSVVRSSYNRKRLIQFHSNDWKEHTEEIRKIVSLNPRANIVIQIV